MHLTGRKLGHVLEFSSKTVSGLLAHRDTIRNALWKHGCICIKKMDLNPAQMTQFTSQMWNQAIELPKFLMFNNQDESYKTVARVGNILIDGSLKDSQEEATYWHQDGDFWGEGQKHVFNCLHTKEEPAIGGDTFVMDLVGAAEFLKTRRPQVYNRLKELVGELNLEKIQDFKLYNAKNILDVPTVTHHKLIRPFKDGKDEVMFLSVQRLLDSLTLEPALDLSIEQVLDILHHEMGYYAHKWEKGDILIWDNLQVMHRASGKFEGRRLLLRTQGRQIPSLL